MPFWEQIPGFGHGEVPACGGSRCGLPILPGQKERPRMEPASPRAEVPLSPARGPWGVYLYYPPCTRANHAAFPRWVRTRQSWGRPGQASGKSPGQTLSQISPRNERRNSISAPAAAARLHLYLSPPCRTGWTPTRTRVTHKR